jgi:thiamine biosynthesis lipoprotein
MGVAVRLVVYAPKESVAQDACRAAFDRFEELEQVMSDYRPTSELMRLCDRAGGPPVRVSRDLYDVLSRSQEVSRRSDGAFDVTVGPLVKLWRTSRKNLTLPTPEEIAEAKAKVGWRKMLLDPKKRTVRLLVTGMKLDLGGIGKGYGADQAIRVLRKYGIRSALVEAGGDIVVSDSPPGTNGWRIAVANRTDRPDDTTPEELFVHHSAVSSSGDTEQSVEIGGKRYSHIVNPATGLGLTNRVAVTVIASNGSTSDPLTKAMSILPKERALAVAQAYHVRVWIRYLPLMGSSGDDTQPP